MYKIGVIGDRDSVLGFKAVGMSVYPVVSSDEAARLLHELGKKDYAVIYITEQAAANIMDEIDAYKDKMYPVIVLIPGNQGSLGIGMQGVKKSVERAVGADILFNEK
jgi:V/A-type H+-transporting ATPase subunit F